MIDRILIPAYKAESLYGSCLLSTGFQAQFDLAHNVLPVNELAEGQLRTRRKAGPVAPDVVRTRH
jgi:hypothetical protein